MVVTKGFGNNGVSDFICNVGGLFVAVETKATGHTGTKLQSLYIQKKVADCGAWGIVLSANGIRVCRPWGNLDEPDLLLTNQPQDIVLGVFEKLVIRIINESPYPKPGA